MGENGLTQKQEQIRMLQQHLLGLQPDTECIKCMWNSDA